MADSNYTAKVVYMKKKISFSKYGNQRSKGAHLSPIELYNTLSPVSSHTYLRPHQTSVLQALQDRATQQDTVLKLPTGAGKTTIGLLYLASHMRNSKLPVAFLCPTKQLVSQVLAEAQRLRLPAEDYPAGTSLPPDRCSAAEAIIVCTYDKLFNARSTFNRPDVGIVPYAVVLDDAHLGIDYVRKQFRLSIQRSDPEQSVMWGGVWKLLLEAIKTMDESLAAKFESENCRDIVRLPFWAWNSVYKKTRDVVAANIGERTDWRFSFDYLQQNFELATAYISQDTIEISLELPALTHIPQYSRSSKRLFMSATLPNDHDLRLYLGCSAKAVGDPIVCESGVGERMVLAPSLFDKKLDREWVANWCSQLGDQHNVVVLTSSNSQAEYWGKKIPSARLITKDNLEAALKQLENSRAGVYVFAQRYDGVDLKDDMCRVLVLDGIPHGESLAETFDTEIATAVNHAHPKMVTRIEQGMGRAVRSSKDYAVVVLAGDRLASFVSKVTVLSRMSAETRRHLELARELKSVAEQEGVDPETSVKDMAESCLSRDEEWRGFYEGNMQDLDTQKTGLGELQLLVADSRRKAFDACLAKSSNEAVATLREATNSLYIAEKDETSVDMVDVRIAKCQLLRDLAKYSYSSDQAESLRILASSKKYGVVTDQLPASYGGLVKRALRFEDTAQMVLNWYKGFQFPEAVLSEISTITSQLDFENDSEDFEDGILKLGTILGAISTRPEKELGKGPDNLWMWRDGAIVIECKSMMKADYISKAYSAQLLDSCEWFRKEYPGVTYTPVIVCPTRQFDSAANPSPEMRIVDRAVLDSFIVAAASIAQALVSRSANDWSANAFAQNLVTHKVFFVGVRDRLRKYTQR